MCDDDNKWSVSIGEKFKLYLTKVDEDASSTELFSYNGNLKSYRYYGIKPPSKWNILYHGRKLFISFFVSSSWVIYLDFISACTDPTAYKHSNLEDCLNFYQEPLFELSQEAEMQAFCEEKMGQEQIVATGTDTSRLVQFF